MGFLLVLSAFAVLAIRNGPDASWDLRNYHLYDPFALLHGRLAIDIAPAQRQTFFPPQLDLIYYGLRSLLNTQPILLACILSVPHAIATWLTWRIAVQFIPLSMPSRSKLGMLAAAIGATGAAALPTLAEAGSDILPTCCCLGGLLLLLTDMPQPRFYRRIASAGLLFGAAAALKLTAAPFCVGAALAMLIAPVVPIRRRLSLLAVFSLACLAAVAVIAGPWCLLLYAKYANPIFPLFNNLFHSPYYPPLSLTDDRFKPADLAQAVAYPLFWAADPRPRVSESAMRDPRVAVAYIAAIVTILRAAACRRLPDAKSTLLIVFWCVSYVMWEMAFSIFRYLAPLEFLSAIILLAAIDASRPAWGSWVAIGAFGCLAVLLTVYPTGGHARRGPQAVAVRLPSLPANALVVMLDGAPMAYVAAFAPPSVRFLGANNNFIQPGQATVLQRQVATAIQNATDPLWGLENPHEAPGVADTTLAAYRLHRAPGCAPVASNLDGNALMLCPLVREK